jgi:uncharacterized membrane protein YqjE
LKAESIVEELTGAVASARGLLSNLLDLFGLEAQRAGLTMVLMLACGATGALLFAAAWIGLMAALALWTVTQGVGWEAALAAVAFATLVAALALCWLCVRASRGLAFPATRRQLRPKLEAV